mmetsp:Transcript_50152/g.109002  ORF Transcript_50152/g.109002 Transcript_50152/m.109002 type:complete len:212 (-) Transcript_50152:181-816(-)
MRHIRVHSYGACEHNKDFEGSDLGQDSRKKIALQGTYRFCICFDNTDQRDYVSEKFFHALASGCVPVYMGAPNIKDYLPSPAAAVVASDFPNATALGEHLKHLLAHPDEYDQMLQWKGGGPHSKTEKLGRDRLVWLQYLSFVTAPCRLCERLVGLTEMRSPEQQRVSYLEGASTLVRSPAFKRFHDKDGADNFDKSEELFGIVMRGDGVPL